MLNLRSEIDRCTDTPYRDSKGWLNAFGCVSFAPFLSATQRKADKYQLRAILSAHQSVGAVKVSRTVLNHRSQNGRRTDTPYRVSKGWLNAFGCVSFAAFLSATQRKADKCQQRASMSAHESIGAVQTTRTYLTDAAR